MYYYTMNTNNFSKLLIIGHARHGKDTVAEIISNTYNMPFRSSSDFVAERLMFPILSKKYGYKNHIEAYNDRHNHRAEWHDLIHDYCKDDAARLGREIFAENSIYCGLRNKTEFHAIKNEGIFDYCIWVDRCDLLPQENRSSMSLEPWMADFVIDNNRDLAHLNREVVRLMNRILKVRS